MLLFKVALLLNVFLILFSAAQENSAQKFYLTVPIFFDIPKHLKFLVPKTQELLDNLVSTRDFEIDYKVELLYGKNAGSYSVKLDYAMDEAFFISPYGKTITIFQTDILIAHNKVHELLAQVINDFLLSAEMDYFDRNTITERDNIAIEIGPTHDVGVYVMASRDYNWNNDLFQGLLQPAIDELQKLLHLNLEFNYYYEEDNTFVHLEDIESQLSYDKLTFLIYLSDKELRIPGIDSKQVLIPKKGALQLVEVPGELSEMQQIEILEVMTGQLFRLLGMQATDPKSPFIRIDFLIRRQIYSNYLKLNKEQQLVINEILSLAKWGEALRKTWEFLRS